MSTLDVTFNNKFWSEVFGSWIDYRTGMVESENDFLYHPIWNSEICKVQGMIQYKRILKNAGLIYFKDLFKDDGTLYGYEEFKTKFGAPINFVDFYSLTHSIDTNMKRKVPSIDVSSIVFTLTNHTEMILSKNNCADTYTQPL